VSLLVQEVLARWLALSVVDEGKSYVPDEVSNVRA
jgi:hypothetical protein